MFRKVISRTIILVLPLLSINGYHSGALCVVFYKYFSLILDSYI
jgi:hypothetical protein